MGPLNPGWIPRRFPVRSGNNESQRCSVSCAVGSSAQCQRHGLLFGLILLSSTALRSHTRPSGVSRCRQRRMKERPQQLFRRQTGRNHSDAQNFLLTPSSPTDHSYQKHRSEKAAKMRRAIKACRTEKNLKQLFTSAEAAGLVDTSVLTAGLQTCGYKFWWDMLLWLLKTGEKLQVPVNPITLSVLFKAMVCCFQASGVQAGSLLRRKASALHIARHVFSEVAPETELEYNALLASVTRLLDEIGTTAALTWADELWLQPTKQEFRTNIVTYTVRLQLLEQHGRKKQVDELLRTGLKGGRLEPDVVLLGGLINAAARNRDWRRADELWRHLVTRRKVQANVPAFTAYAKAHLLCGRPAMTVQIIEDMVQHSVGRLDYKVSEMYLQSLLILCHSSPTPETKSQLSAASQEHERLVTVNVPRSFKECWKQLSGVITTCLSDPAKLRLRDILITRLVRKESIMKDWDNFSACSLYLH